MKKYARILYLALFAAMSVTAVSCGGDDDEDQPGNASLWQGELANPRYEADAVAYKISNSRDFGIIELTSSGNYIVMPPASGNYAPAVRRSLLKADRHKASRGYDETNLFGTYTKNADGTYNLLGFGKLGAYANGVLDLTLENGTSYSLDATPLPNVESNALNNRLCRTWYLEKAVENAYGPNGELLHTTTTTGPDLKEEYVKYIVVTKAGTFLRVDYDNDFDGGRWGWIDTAAQTAWYRFDEEGDYDGQMQVQFVDDLAIFTEYYDSEYVDGIGQVAFQSVVTCRAN